MDSWWVLKWVEVLFFCRYGVCDVIDVEGFCCECNNWYKWFVENFKFVCKCGSGVDCFYNFFGGINDFDICVDVVCFINIYYVCLVVCDECVRMRFCNIWWCVYIIRLVRGDKILVFVKGSCFVEYGWVVFWSEVVFVSIVVDVGNFFELEIKWSCFKISFF